MIGFIDDHRAAYGRRRREAPHAKLEGDVAGGSSRSAAFCQSPKPNSLWLSLFTDVATWSGFVYVAFVIDTFSRRIVGWKASRTAHASVVLDALEQALHARPPKKRDGLVHHSDRGVQYVSIRYTDRLVEAGVLPSVGSVGDNAKLRLRSVLGLRSP